MLMRIFEKRGPPVSKQEDPGGRQEYENEHHRYQRGLAERSLRRLEHRSCDPAYGHLIDLARVCPGFLVVC